MLFLSTTTVGIDNLCAASRNASRARLASTPSISRLLNPASPDGDNGWYRSDVTLDWTVTEPQLLLAIVVVVGLLARVIFWPDRRRD